MRTKHWPHPLLEDGPGVAPPLEPPGAPIPDEPFKLKPLKADFPANKISPDATLDSYIEAVMEFERERVIIYTDPTTDGLQLRLGRHRATWLFYWDDRRHRRRKITSKRLGFFPAMRTADARDAARIERGRVAAGDVGPGKREAVKVETSLAEYVAHLERKAAAKHKPARWAYNVRHLVKSIIAPRWGQWSLADVAMHPGAVADWHRDVTEANGPVSANHCSRVLRAAYKRSAKRDVSLPQRDPCSAVDYNIETPAQKAMAFRDFPKWLKAWQTIEVGPKAPARKEYHLFCLLTGMRPGEAARIRWRDVKPALRVVEIPGAKASNTIQIVMSAPIARVLKEARELVNRRIATRSCSRTADRREIVTIYPLVVTPLDIRGALSPRTAELMNYSRISCSGTFRRISAKPTSRALCSPPGQLFAKLSARCRSAFCICSAPIRRVRYEIITCGSE